LDANAAYARAWYAAHPEKKREQYEKRKARLTSADHKRWNLARYGLTVEAFEGMWASQDGKCAICERAMVRAQRGAASVVVDHCHGSLIVRGLLCSGCNRGIGIFGEDPKILERASNYLTA
jgi:hypothetical protein